MDILRLNVLLVNEDPVLLEKMEGILSEQGFTFRSAANLDEAKKFIDQESFQVLVADMTMPDNDGIELCKIYGSRLPIVMIHGTQDHHAQNKLKSFSCCFLEKGDMAARLAKATWTAFKRFKIDQQIERDLVAA